ncbi:putative choline transporter, neither null mutation nor overexpression affects choline transport [Geranomyces michiganensis]|nr:putative choline transporter, neither null mutation nor overexpression affects choline transport [Geranomyces michiganensis]
MSHHHHKAAAAVATPKGPPPTYQSLPNYQAAAAGASSSSGVDVNGHHHDGSEADGLLGGQSEKFNRSPAYKDVWATVLWVVHLAFLLALTVAGFKVDVPERQPGDSQPSPPGRQRPHEAAADPTVPIGDYPSLSDAGPMFAAAIIGGFGFSVLYVLAIRRFASQLITASFLGNTVVAGTLGLFYLASGAMIPAFFALAYAAIHVFMYFLYRSRMEFSRVMLENVINIADQYRATFVASLAGSVVQTFWVLTWLVSAIAGARLVQSTENDFAKYAVVTYVTFSLYWTSQIIKNVVHVTVSGVFATYYFTAIQTAEGSVVVPVRNPTIKSAKRALTTSFGSIAFGSLIVALIQTLRAVLNTIRRNAQDDNNNALALAATCADCILSMVEAFVAFINVYAYTQVAIYGKSYLEAGRDTWALLQSRGIDLIINDDLTNGVLSMGGILVAFVSGTLGYTLGLIKDYTPPMIWSLAALGFVAGLLQFWVLAEVVRSGVATTFVCLAEDPDALQRTKPQLYREFAHAYPASVRAGDYGV